jgi:hypothetical protein
MTMSTKNTQGKIHWQTVDGEDFALRFKKTRDACGRSCWSVISSPISKVCKRYGYDEPIGFLYHKDRYWSAWVRPKMVGLHFDGDLNGDASECPADFRTRAEAARFLLTEVIAREGANMFRVRIQVGRWIAPSDIYAVESLCDTDLRSVIRVALERVPDAVRKSSHVLVWDDESSTHNLIAVYTIMEQNLVFV